MIQVQLGTIWAVVLALSGCALTSKSDPLVPRYYNPEGDDALARPAADGYTGSGRVITELRLGRVTGASYLGERIVYRDSSHELGYYDERRWSEKPDIYLRRALGRAFFEQHGVHRLLAGAGPTLDVELTAFEELRSPTPTARVSATFILQDGRVVLREQTITVDRPIGGSDKQRTAEQAVAALSLAFGDLVNRMTTLVIGDLDKRALRSRPGSNPGID